MTMEVVYSPPIYVMDKMIVMTILMNGTAQVRVSFRRGREGAFAPP